MRRFAAVFVVAVMAACSAAWSTATTGAGPSMATSAAGSSTATSAAAGIPPLWWEPWAAGFWVVNHSAINRLFNNGECTEWAARKRPALVREMIQARIAYEVQHRLPEILPNLNARYWPADASAAGVATGTLPVRGALVAFQPGVLRAGPRGHIAYVERVYRDGSFKISQMNARFRYRVTHERLRSWTARLRGVRFIYWQTEVPAATTRS